LNALSLPETSERLTIFWFLINTFIIPQDLQIFSPNTEDPELCSHSNMGIHGYVRATTCGSQPAGTWKMIETAANGCFLRCWKRIESPRHPKLTCSLSRWLVLDVRTIPIGWNPASRISLGICLRPRQN
jgi:hypothetical protein